MQFSDSQLTTEELVQLDRGSIRIGDEKELRRRSQHHGAQGLNPLATNRS